MKEEHGRLRKLARADIVVVAVPAVILMQIAVNLIAVDKISAAVTVIRVTVGWIASTSIASYINLRGK